MYQGFGKTKAVTVTAAVGPQVSQSVVMADGFSSFDGLLTLKRSGEVVSMVSHNHLVAIDPRDLQDLTPAAIVTGEGRYESNVKIEQGTKLYPWPDPRVAELEKRLEALKNDYEAENKRVRELQEIVRKQDDILNGLGKPEPRKSSLKGVE